MNLEELHNYCSRKKGAEECFPFGDDTLVFKVYGKMFILIDLDGEMGMNLKCDPEKSLQLREHYSSITGAYHMNKKHWITLVNDGTIPDKLIYELIDESYQLVVSRVPKSKKTEKLNIDEQTRSAKHKKPAKNSFKNRI